MIRNKILLLSLLLLGLCPMIGLAQPYGNEWIDQNQRYFKMNIAEDGIYRMTQSELADFGFPVSSVDPRKVQVFHQGQEIAINFEGQLDGIIDGSDYLEFYATKANGTFDTQLYTVPAAQPHTFHNIFSDSSAYFITYKLNTVTGLRMSEFGENNVGGIPADNYYIDNNLLLLTSSYYEGKSYGINNKIILPTYDYGEGWTGPFGRQGQNLDYTLSGLLNSVEDDIDPQVEILLVGGNNNQHSVDILVGPNTGSLRNIKTVTFNADENILISETIAWTDISAGGDLVIRTSINGVDGNADRVSVSYLNVDYSKAYNLNSVSSTVFKMKPNVGNKSYIEASNTLSNVILFDITDTSNPISIVINETGSDYNAVIPNTATQKTLYSQSGTKTVTNCKEISFSNFNPTSFNYLLIGHEGLRGNTTSGLGDQVTAFKTYRQSTAGGGHTVLDINIDQVFNQFNFGNPSPLAIKRFCEYVYDGGSPEFLFLIGKASNVQAGFYREDPLVSTTKHFIPTYGYPGGDAPFTEGFDSVGDYATIATGRINATHPDHIEAYLNKVIEEEEIPFNTLRQKNLVHLSGGGSENELNAFKSYIKGFSATAAGQLLGGESAEISKNNNGAVELINISDEINAGVMMVTFFGHSSGSVTDIEIGLVSDPSFGYSNKGKYPIFMVNGCLAGDFFSTNESFGVDWVLTPNLGALGFMAHSHVAFSSNLRRYTDLFYNIAFTDPSFVSKSVGEIKLETARQYIGLYGNSTSSVSQVQLINLQGDPAVKVFGPDKPDFDINENFLKAGTFDGSQLLATVDSFYLEMNVKNYGIYSDEDFNVEVTRTFADGSAETYGPFLFDKILREDTLKFTINNDVSNPQGTNTFQITLDPRNTIDEMDKINNTATLDVFLSSGNTFNLFPSNFSIQKESPLDFYFQSSNLLAGTRSFDIQIDTSATFNSPYLISQSLSSKVIGKININLESSGSITDEKVFYWRTRFTDPLPTENNEWITTSFVLDKSLNEGWSQSNPNQLDQATKEGLTLNSTTGLWEFLTTQLELEVQNYGSNHPVSDYKDTQVLLNGRNYYLTNSHLDPGCRNNTINFLAFKRQSTVPFKVLATPGFDENQPLVCGLLPQVIYNYTQSDLTDLIYGPEAFIDNLEVGDNVVIYSLGNVDYPNWPNSLKDKLVELGMDRARFDLLQTDEPVIIIGAKNATAASASLERTAFAPANEQFLNRQTNIIGNFDSGEISSSIIGPAQSWSRLDVDIQASANAGQDWRYLSYYGVRPDKSEVFIDGSLSTSTFDLSTIDANIYPYLRMQLEVKDEFQFTPHQLKSWQLDYEPTPEGILLINDLAGTVESIEVQEGQEQSVSYTYWNFSKKNFLDSIHIAFDLLNGLSNVKISDSLKIAALANGDSAQFELQLSTIGNTGMNDLILNTNSKYPFEVYSFNNSTRFSSYLNVIPDETNPLIDVSFDGVQIMEGDIVSPSPSIEINITDDNSFLLINDTTGINIYLRSPCEDCDFERIAFSSVYMQWSPAAPDEDFKATYAPDKLEDGLYGIRVLANDASGNPSGLKPYEINFEVINESTVTNFYPYPNPFSSSTRFVFTLTGSELPEDIKIQILTISGRVVKEIFMDELGAINIGNNLTDYAWDGRDNYGDQLANGVYLYRVLIKNPGENFQHRVTSGDRGFKNGFGKMYLLR